MVTVVAFHAHPDDEAVLTGGTLAKAAAAGHRVVIVTATDGRMGNELDETRMNELRSSAEILGVSRVECLGYADSGYGPIFYDDPPGRVRFARASLDEAAQQLANILRAEDAQLLLSYEANGGYGHRDHVQVHHVGRRAAELAGTRACLKRPCHVNYYAESVTFAVGCGCQNHMAETSWRRGMRHERR
jgi:LmbE family N-acetylglucosaminyl deacetylase